MNLANHHLIFLFGLLLFGPFAYATTTPPPDPTELPPIVLIQGEQRLLRLPGFTRYSLGSDLARAHPAPGKDTLLIKGARPGITDLWVWNSDGESNHRTVRVDPPAHPTAGGAATAALERALEKLEETEVIRAGPMTVLRGEVTRAAESARIAALVRAFPDAVRDETELSEDLLQEGLGRITAWLATSPFAGKVLAEIRGQRLVVHGSVPKATDRPAVEQKIRSLFAAATLEIDALPDGAPTVHFRVYLLELHKSRFGSFGISWPETVPGAFQIANWSAREAIKLDLAIQALEGEGTARVLSRPELVVRAPGEAELFAGGEIPIKTLARGIQNVTWRAFGLTLKLKVTHVAGEKVRLDIHTEVSQLDSNIGIDDIPGLQANRMNTQVDARFGSPLLLSGLLQDGMRRQAKGLPLLRRIPVLGSLFGSEDYLNQRSELVAILVPSTSPPRAPMERVRPPRPRAPVDEDGDGDDYTGRQPVAEQGIRHKVAVFPARAR